MRPCNVREYVTGVYGTGSWFLFWSIFMRVGLLAASCLSVLSLRMEQLGSHWKNFR